MINEYKEEQEWIEGKLDENYSLYEFYKNVDDSEKLEKLELRIGRDIENFKRKIEEINEKIEKLEEQKVGKFKNIIRKFFCFDYDKNKKINKEIKNFNWQQNNFNKNIARRKLLLKIIDDFNESKSLKTNDFINNDVERLKNLVDSTGYKVKLLESNIEKCDQNIEKLEGQKVGKFKNTIRKFFCFGYDKNKKINKEINAINLEKQKIIHNTKNANCLINNVNRLKSIKENVNQQNKPKVIETVSHSNSHSCDVSVSSTLGKHSLSL